MISKFEIRQIAQRTLRTLLHSQYEMDNNGGYPFNLRNVKEFAEFAEQSGGFTIC